MVKVTSSVSRLYEARFICYIQALCHDNVAQRLMFLDFSFDPCLQSQRKCLLWLSCRIACPVSLNTHHFLHEMHPIIPILPTTMTPVERAAVGWVVAVR